MPSVGAWVVGVVLAVGLLGAIIDIARHAPDTEVRVSGALSAREVLQSFHPTGRAGVDDPRPHLRRGGASYLVDADGVALVRHAGAPIYALWAAGELLPWVLAAVLMALLLRPPDGARALAARLRTVGAALVVGVPAVALLRFVAAEQAKTVGSMAAPMVDPTFTIGVEQLGPGVAVLLFAGVLERMAPGRAELWSARIRGQGKGVDGGERLRQRACHPSPGETGGLTPSPGETGGLTPSPGETGGLTPSPGGSLLPVKQGDAQAA